MHIENHICKSIAYPNWFICHKALTMLIIARRYIMFLLDAAFFHKLQIFTGIFFILFSELAQCDEPHTFRWNPPITLHTIILADQNDATIGLAVKASTKLVKELVHDISARLKINSNVIELSGDLFKEEAALKTLSNLDVEKLDAVFFFYFGHGNIKKTPEKIFPDLQADKSIQYDKVITLLIKKKPRLLISIADACNSPLKLQDTKIPILTEDRFPQFNPYNTPELTSSYSRLFIETTGVFIISSAMKGQQAFYDPIYGGVYTNLFVRSVRELLRHYRPKWAMLQPVIFPSVSYQDLYSGTNFDQTPISIVSFKDLVNVYAHSTTSQCNSKNMNDYTSCLNQSYNIDGRFLNDLIRDTESFSIPILDEKSLLSLAFFSNRENISYELMALAQRYYWGDGVLRKSFKKSIELIARAADLGNFEAPGVIGDMELCRFEEKHTKEALTNALKWYSDGYKRGDIRSGQQWAMLVFEYINSPDIINKGIQILKKIKNDPDAAERLEGMCKNGYKSACQLKETK